MAHTMLWDKLQNLLYPSQLHNKKLQVLFANKISNIIISYKHNQKNISAQIVNYTKMQFHEQWQMLLHSRDSMYITMKELMY